jgi:hypothetical protein
MRAAPDCRLPPTARHASSPRTIAVIARREKVHLPIAEQNFSDKSTQASARCPS